MARKAKCIGFGVFEEQYISKENQLLNIIYLELLRKHTPKLEEELQMTIKATVTGGKRTGAGRKKREVTAEMLADLKVLPIDVYCEKHKCSESFFLNLYYKNVSTEVVEKIVTEVVEKEVESDIFRGLLIETDVLFKYGMNKYESMLFDKHSNLDLRMSDILHKIELHELNSAEKITLIDMIAEVRSEKRLVVDSIAFVKDNKHKIIDMLELKKAVDARVKQNSDRVYGVRVMKKEFGETIEGSKR